MFRVRQSVILPCGLLLLASFSRPLFTSVHNRFAKPHSRVGLINGNEKSAKAHQLNTDYGKLPIYFEPNLGQTDSQVKFIARSGGVTTFLTANEAVFSLPQGRHSRGRGNPDPVTGVQQGMSFFGLRSLGRSFGLDIIDSGPRNPDSQTPLLSPQSTIANRQLATSMKLVGANPKARSEGLDRLPGISNYFIGNDPAKWRTSIPHYAKVQYREVYPGIDLVYYGTHQQLEYDFVVKPGGNPAAIRLAFQGTEDIKLDGNGDLLIHTAFGEMRQRRPSVYQTRGEEPHQVAGRYVVDAGSNVSFELGSYDVGQTLVIDPVVVYSTSFGGIMGEHVSGIAVDSQGNAYVTGSTLRTGFPVTSGAFQTEITVESGRGFIAKLNATGSALMYATYLSSSIQAIAVDPNGQAVLVGITGATDHHPVTSGAFQTQLRGPADGFITKLNASGSALIYSSYLGGSGDDSALTLALDSSGSAYVSGLTNSLDFPVTPGAFLTTSTSSGRGDVLTYVTKLNSSATAAVYSTYLGRAGLADIAVDSAGSAYVVGGSTSPDFPVSSNAFQKTLRGDQDAVAVKLNPTGTALEYSTFLGSTATDWAIAIAVDRDGYAYLTGSTNGPDFPTTPGAHDTVYQGYLQIRESEPFVTKLNPTGTALTYSTFLNGTRSLYGRDIAVDAAGNAHIVSGDFVSKLDAAGAVLRFSQSVARTPGDDVVALALDPAGNVYAAGSTTLRPPLRSPSGGVLEFGISPALVVKLSGSDTIPQFVPIVLSAAGLNGSFYTSELTLTNRSTNNATLRFSYTATFSEGSGMGSDQLPAGQQQIVPDALAYLRSIGIPIPASGNRGGTLRMDAPDDVFASVRTANTTASGRAGLSYTSFPTLQGFKEPTYLHGLRQNERDRSNVAIQNVGSTSEGEITLRLTVFPGEPNSSARGLYEERLAPGEFRQITGILADRGLSFAQGFVRVERISGMAPYFAYAVVNDQVTSDGSFIPPILSYAMNGRSGLTIPVMVETSQFSSELILANSSGTKRTLQLAYRADAIQTADQTASLTLDLNPLQQLIIPDFVQFLRSRGAQGLEATNTSYAGPLFVTAQAIDLPGVFVGARTSTRGTGGQYGVFYPGTPLGSGSTNSAWLHGLRQDSENRTNLAIVNTGEIDATDSRFEIEIFDGATGQQTGTRAIVLVPAKSWRQIGNILAPYASSMNQGYARVTKVFGSNRFVTYAVINDGATPGERTGDGAFIASSP